MIDAIIREYNEMQEELVLLSNPEHLARIAEARAAYEAGETVNFKDYMANRHNRGRVLLPLGL